MGTTLAGVLTLVLLSCGASSVIAADCFFNTNKAINTVDIMNLAKDVGINNFSPPLESPMGFTPATVHGVVEGTAQFCIRNSFLFESTHITLSDIQFGANDIISQCCGGPVCQGGQFTITGDNKITVILNVQPADFDCEP